MTEANKNIAIWQQSETTPASAVKQNTGGNTKKSIDGYYMIRKATELFGPCGIGWGYEILKEEYEQGAPNVSADGGSVIYNRNHTLQIKLWYMLDGKRGEIIQYGHTKALYKANSGKWISDEEAPKKSLTDAIKKSLSMIGIGADVFTGQFNDVNYEQERAREEAYEKADQMEARQREDHDEAMEAVKAEIDLVKKITNPKAVKIGARTAKSQIAKLLARQSEKYGNYLDVQSYCAKANAQIDEHIQQLENGVDNND
jgi:hypothetical protein